MCVCPSLPCSLASSRWQASLRLVVSWCPEHLEMMFSEQYFLWTIKKKNLVLSELIETLGRAAPERWTRPCEESTLACGAGEDTRCLAGLGPGAAHTVKILQLNYRQRDFLSFKSFKTYRYCVRGAFLNVVGIGVAFHETNSRNSCRLSFPQQTCPCVWPWVWAELTFEKPLSARWVNNSLSCKKLWCFSPRFLLLRILSLGPKEDSLPLQP